jgi:hypothetical protein
VKSIIGYDNYAILSRRAASRIEKTKEVMEKMIIQKENAA